MASAAGRTSGYRWPGGPRLRGQGVTARVIVVLRDDWLWLRQVGALVPVGVAASKKTESVCGLVPWNLGLSWRSQHEMSQGVAIAAKRFHDEHFTAD
jgi:hypothetical protein